MNTITNSSMVQMAMDGQTLYKNNVKSVNTSKDQQVQTQSIAPTGAQVVQNMEQSAAQTKEVSQQLQKLFVNLCSKHKMAKAGNKNNVQAYGLTQEDVTVISLYKDGQEYEHLFFGDTDFSQTGRYFTTNELNSVFLFDSSFDNYLSVNTQVWCDPYIISSQLKNSVFNMGDIQNLSTDSAQKLLELRHGGFAEQSEIEAVLNNTTKQLEDIHLQMGDKSTIVLSIYNSILTDNEYILKTTFISDRTGQSFSYFTKISLWTYNKISEITL